jgi:hypothetical protein
MASDSEAGQLGLLRVEIASEWGVAELGSYLSNLDQTYRLAAALAFLAADPTFPFHYGWPAISGSFSEESGTRNIGELRISPPDMSELKALAIVRAEFLRVRSIKFESPGWVVVLGSSKPLKVVAAGIASWNDEKRERASKKRAFQLELLDRMPPSVQARYAAVLLEETLERTRQLALEVQVEKVSLTETTP